MAYELFTPIYDMSSVEYHSTAGTWSSSQIKDAKKPELFYAKYIAKTTKREENPVFDVGTYVHTGVLEPDKLNDDCIVYPGKIRRGADWNKFKVKHADKAIVTPGEVAQAENLIKAIQGSPVAMGYIKRGTPEVSIFIQVVVSRGDIYCPGRKTIHTMDGWKEIGGSDTAKIFKDPNAIPLILKVRADSLGEDFVLDVKTTSGDCTDDFTMRGVISRYSYDLSAAMYLDVFSAGLDRPIEKFIWTFASKEQLNSKSYRASERNIQVGRKKFRNGIFNLANGLLNDWQFSDTLGILEPNGYELDHLITSDADLL